MVEEAVLKDFTNPIFEKYEKFLASNGILIAGIEFITNQKGQIYTYDINTNTNYNLQAESKVGVSGMGAIAKYLGNELEHLFD